MRLYETRDSKNGVPDKTTMAEAQLIGRGARYCHFQINKEQPKYKRKYDNDKDNELHVCEELYYHCQNDSRYINELHNALREIGIDLDKTVKQRYVLKDSFKDDDLYRNGIIFINDRIVKDRKNVHGLLPEVRDQLYPVTISTGRSSEDIVMDDNNSINDSKLNLKICHTTIGKIAKINYALINKALMKYPVYKYNTLESYFPNIHSTREFITSLDYLGNVRIDIKSRTEQPSVKILFDAVCKVLGKISNSISGIEETYYGTEKFKTYNIRDVFHDKTVNYTDPHNGEVGVSQNDSSVKEEWKMDLSKEDWFAYTDNFGTSEEKAFVAYFSGYVNDFRKKYNKVYLVRNEREFHIYSFDDGLRFEPDYVLFLQKKKFDGFEQWQIFIEPKGGQLLEKDAWKEDFLLQMEGKAIPTKIFKDDNKYKIWGLHFYNVDKCMKQFDDDFRRLLE
mgnify:FL=1